MADFLVTAGRRPWRWGEFDCCMFFADWVEIRSDLDPAAHLRGTYSNEREMRRLVKAHGGIVRLVGDCMAGVGWRPTSSPQAGDIGLVRIGIKLWRGRVVTVPTGAVAVSQSRWAVKTMGGLAVGQFPLVQAWQA